MEISIETALNQRIVITAFVSVEGTTIERRFTKLLEHRRNITIGELYEHKDLPEHDIRVRCHLVIEDRRFIPPTLKLSLFDVMGDCQNVNSDAEFKVGYVSIPFHRGYFAMLSPVFYAMFNHETEEKRTGIVEIKDMDFTTVHNAVNFCYGHVLEDKTTFELLNVLAFGDKYDIRIITKNLLEWITMALNPFNFCLILNYACTTSNEKLIMTCSKYFLAHIDPIVLTPEFGLLRQDVMCELMQRVIEI
uniref:BTB domain-containing protein n=1 Tax=Panagrellus redivivus TaxID=6233 RepID=A0A7E4V4Q6_PANRE